MTVVGEKGLGPKRPWIAKLIELAHCAGIGSKHFQRENV